MMKYLRNFTKVTHNLAKNCFEITSTGGRKKYVYLAEYIYLRGQAICEHKLEARAKLKFTVLYLYQIIQLLPTSYINNGSYPAF